MQANQIDLVQKKEDEPAKAKGRIASRKQGIGEIGRLVELVEKAENKEYKCSIAGHQGAHFDPKVDWADIGRESNGGQKKYNT